MLQFIYSMTSVYKKFGVFVPIVGILILGMVGLTLAQIDAEPIEVTDRTLLPELLPPEPPTPSPEPITPVPEVVMPNSLDNGGIVPPENPTPPALQDNTPQLSPHSVEAEPEFTIVKEVAERYVFDPQTNTGLPLVEIMDDRGTLRISGTCSDSYYVILLFRGAEDHIAQPGSYIVNRAYPCEGGAFSYSITNDHSLPNNLDGAYHLFVGSQGETGAWQIVSPIIPVQIRKEVTEREIRVPVPRAQTPQPPATLIPEVITPPVPGQNSSAISPQTGSAPVNLEMPLTDSVPPPDSVPETLNEPQVDSVDAETETEMLPPTPDENWQVFETELPPPPPQSEEGGVPDASPSISIWRQWWRRLIAKWQPDILALLWLK